MQKWQYKILNGYDEPDFEDRLNASGLEGWEVVACPEEAGLILKRPLKD